MIKGNDEWPQSCRSHAFLAEAGPGSKPAAKVVNPQGRLWGLLSHKVLPAVSGDNMIFSLFVCFAVWSFGHQ